MNLSITTLIGTIFLSWIIYFALGAFANMTENKYLLKAFKLSKYIIGIILISLFTYYMFYQ